MSNKHDRPATARAAPAPTPDDRPDTERRLAGEQRHFEGAQAYKALPDISQYWSKRYLQPRVREVFGTRNQYDFYARPILARAAQQDQVRVLSLGSGNGQVELKVAAHLSKRGARNVSIDGLEYSRANVDAANEAAGAQGLGGHLRFHQGDFNQLDAWRERPCDFLIANQILHHVTALESLFDAAAGMLGDGGVLLTRDIIGRNGHRAWPEARELIDRVWSDMPRRYRYNHRQARVVDAFPDHDYSKKSFEGVRAQDILPLMLERFSFERFYAFGGLTERFLNRAFGANYSQDNEDDLSFINTLELLNDTAVDGGIIKPTQMLAYVSVRPSELRCWRHRTPGHCLRTPD